MENHTVKTEELFEELFNSIDEIDNTIQNLSKKLSEDHIKNMEISLRQISKSIDKIEKKLKISPIYKIKSTFVLQMLTR